MGAPGSNTAPGAPWTHPIKGTVLALNGEPSMQRRGCHAILTAVGCCKGCQGFILWADNDHWLDAALAESSDLA
jgi:hypothetical protein